MIAEAEVEAAAARPRRKVSAAHKSTAYRIGIGLVVIVGSSGEPIERASCQVFPFANIGGLMLLALVVMPRLVTWLPHLLMK